MSKVLQIKLKVSIMVNTCYYTELCKADIGPHFYMYVNREIPEQLTVEQIQKDKSVKGLVCIPFSNPCPCNNSHDLNIEFISIKIANEECGIFYNNTDTDDDITDEDIYMEPNTSSCYYNKNYKDEDFTFLINHIKNNYSLALDTHWNCKCKKEEVYDKYHEGWVGTEGFDTGPMKGLYYL